MVFYQYILLLNLHLSFPFQRVQLQDLPVPEGAANSDSWNLGFSDC